MIASVHIHPQLVETLLAQPPQSAHLLSRMVWIYGCILLSQHIPLCVDRSLGKEVDIGGRVSEFPPVVEVS